ncbi:PREDICTED: bromodomain-containing protein 8-like [Nicrophorus vespilloides]|uniref:Bromodomain-containing protein 8-like n=1 Tax=Nicrophorus vespilloides TaxID=110193 RepID=A0ABM1MYK9_NICVS|nr:PREDICTED: bromodomain-containing protein 8-like [Nicrophorus vespilloides]
MASIQERLQRIREPLDKWSTREQLCLAFAVARAGDQNWMSVSRSLKPFGEPSRPTDWFHQKNCAAQYGALLENVETPKRKKRTSGAETPIETAGENILRRLMTERKSELKKLLEEEKSEYLKLQEEMAILKSGTLTEEQLDVMCKQIDEEEQQKEKESLAHSQWLKERELRKQEIERTWRPAVKIQSPATGVKRKVSESFDQVEVEHVEERPAPQTPTQMTEPPKPALSPLLTSLLKSPSHAQNATSILHSAITNHRPINSNTNPTIASLLNCSASVPVSPGIQQLVTTAISQEPQITTSSVKDTISDLLDETDQLPNLKVEDLESTILSGDDPLPEIKNEEVDVIISDLIENADIVTDPEQHLLEGNDDIITHLENELEELVNKEKAAVAEAAAKAESISAEKLLKEKELPQIDPFEFQEDPVIYEPTKQSSIKQIIQTAKIDEIIDTSEQENSQILHETEIKKEQSEESKTESPEENVPGSVEIVEVVVMEDEEIGKKFNKSQIDENIVYNSKIIDDEKLSVKDEPTESSEEEKTIKDDILSEATSESLDMEIKQESSDGNKDTTNDEDETLSRRNTFTPEYSDIFDDMNIEVTKIDKTGKAKRDYSRTKKKEDTDFDILLAVEQAANLEEDSLSEKEDDKKSIDLLKGKLKIDNDRSNSPWTEEEENSGMRTRRRYSTPATPSDSVPNSPASSTAYVEDDRDYKNWKKSIMLVYSRLATHKYSSLFSKPITNEQAPGYHNVVKRPMDFQTLRKNIESGTIRSTTEFQRDVLLMFNNAIMYNKTNDTVYKMALEMQQEGMEQIRILLQVQAETVPSRRETRLSEGPSSKRKRGNEDNTRNKKKKDE